MGDWFFDTGEAGIKKQWTMNNEQWTMNNYGWSGGVRDVGGSPTHAPATKIAPFSASANRLGKSAQKNRNRQIGGVASLNFNISGSCRQASRRDICQQLMVIQFKEGKHCLLCQRHKNWKFSSLNYKILDERRSKRVPRQGSLRGFRFQRINQKDIKKMGYIPPVR